MVQSNITGNARIKKRWYNYIHEIITNTDTSTSDPYGWQTSQGLTSSRVAPNNLALFLRCDDNLEHQGSTYVKSNRSSLLDITDSLGLSTPTTNIPPDWGYFVFWLHRDYNDQTTETSFYLSDKASFSMGLTPGTEDNQIGLEKVTFPFHIVSVEQNNFDWSAINSVKVEEYRGESAVLTGSGIYDYFQVYGPNNNVNHSQASILIRDYTSTNNSEGMIAFRKKGTNNSNARIRVSFIKESLSNARLEHTYSNNQTGKGRILIKQDHLNYSDSKLILERWQFNFSNARVFIQSDAVGGVSPLIESNLDAPVVSYISNKNAISLGIKINHKYNYSNAKLII